MAGAGIASLFSRFTSITSSAGWRLSIAPFPEPRTEYHPSWSGYNGRLASPGCNPIGLPSSS